MRVCPRFGVMVVALCALVVVGGCAGAREPRFRVVEAELTSESEDGYVVTFVVEGANANDFPLPLREVEYALTLDGERVFAGRRSAEATLPAGGTQRMELPVAVAFGDGVGLPASMAYALSGEVTYVLPGAIAELLFDNRIRTPRASFRERGDLVGG